MTSKKNHQKHRGYPVPSWRVQGTLRGESSGFALVTVLLLISILVVFLAVMASTVSLSQRTVSSERDSDYAKQSALFGLKVALGELQAVAGPDQRITATASILGSPDNPYTDGTSPATGQHAWTGVWKSDTVALPGDIPSYSPAKPDTREFVGWLVSGTDSKGNFALPDSLSDVNDDFRNIPPSAEGVENHVTLVSQSDGTPWYNAEKVFIDEVKRGKRYFAFSVEDESVKADLSWSETPASLTTEKRAQSNRLSAMPGPDYAVFNNPVNGGNAKGSFPVEYPLTVAATDTNSFLSDVIEPMRDPADLESLLDADPDWLADIRGDITRGSFGVLCDVKKGGLRRDLSLAFEMDGDDESENAGLFNKQTEEFVGNGDLQSSPYPMPGVTLNGSDLYARHLFRDYGPTDPLNPAHEGAGDIFSRHITQPETVVRGPSWWLMRDYANLYKRLRAVGNHYALDARAYYPNRAIVEDLIDMHADNQHKHWDYRAIRVSPTNRETTSDKNSYAYRPARASYAPVLLGVNALYSLVYKDGRLQMVVDPFFIVWNPYNTRITTERFAITLEGGLAGGVRFRITDANGKNEKFFGKPSWWQDGAGSDTSFFDFAKHKSEKDRRGSQIKPDLSYLISDLSMDPGEVLIYSPPNENDRSNDADVLNDELISGMNYDAETSGIFFDEFPEYVEVLPRKRPRKFVFSGWKPVVAKNGQQNIEVVFNVASQSGSAIVNIIETNLPVANSNGEHMKPKELTDEANFGNHVAGKEFRLNFGGGQHGVNINTGQRRYSLTYTFNQLGATKQAFGLLSMLTIPTDNDEADTAMEVFSQLNVTPIVRTQWELFGRAPLNVLVKTVSARGINNLMNQVGIDIDAFGDGENGFYGKDFSMRDGDTSLPLLDIPSAPLHSLVQFSGANLGTRLFEPTHPIGNSWKPPYIPTNSIYHNSAAYFLNREELTMNDVSWQINDALFDRYYLSGLAPDFNHRGTNRTYLLKDDLETTLNRFYGDDYTTALANPVLQPHIPEGKSVSEVVAELTPTDSNSDGYKKLGAYSLINGAFNVNSTSVAAWSAFLSGNRDLVVETNQRTTDKKDGTPFPLSSSPSDTNSANEWEKFSRLTDEQIWDDNGTSNNPADDSGLAVEIVNQVKTRGPFMSLSDFVNRRIAVKIDPKIPGDPNDPLAYQGAIQAAIEAADVNGDQYAGIRSETSNTFPNYYKYAGVFPYADDPNYIGKRNNATGIPKEINQANILLPIAPRLTARSDTFRIRAYGEVRNRDESRVTSRATCEVVVQRLPEYMDDTDDPWVEVADLSETNQAFGRRFKVVQFRWLAPDEL